MIQEDEIIMLVIGLSVLIFVFIKHPDFKRIDSFNIMATAFCVLVAGWVMTVLEAFFWNTVLNFLEHMCYAVSAILVAIWFKRVFAKTKGRQ